MSGLGCYFWSGMLFLVWDVMSGLGHLYGLRHCPQSGTLCLAWGISSSLRHLYSIHSLEYLDVVCGLGYHS